MRHIPSFMRWCTTRFPPHQASLRRLQWPNTITQISLRAFDLSNREPPIISWGDLARCETTWDALGWLRTKQGRGDVRRGGAEEPRRGEQARAGLNRCESIQNWKTYQKCRISSKTLSAVKMWALPVHPPARPTDRPSARPTIHPSARPPARPKISLLYGDNKCIYICYPMLKTLNVFQNVYTLGDPHLKVK